VGTHCIHQFLCPPACNLYRICKSRGCKFSTRVFSLQAAITVLLLLSCHCMWLQEFLCWVCACSLLLTSGLLQTSTTEPSNKVSIQLMLPQRFVEKHFKKSYKKWFYLMISTELSKETNKMYYSNDSNIYFDCDWWSHQMKLGMRVVLMFWDARELLCWVGLSCIIWLTSYVPY
jgi:hypothetical protein